MFPAFLFGLLLLVGLTLLAKWFVNTEPRQVLRALYWVVGILILASGLFLALTGRLGWAAAALGATLPWGVRILRAAGVIQVLRGLFGGVGSFGSGPGRGEGASTGGRTSEVSSPYLRMKLSHDTGEMMGVVRTGPLAGRTLDSLDEGELKALIQFVSDDPDSWALLESWLDRERSGWRESGTGQGSDTRAGPDSGGAMTRVEALSILGLEDPVDGEAVRAAYRRLMRRAHPDHGGSTWLAAKVNQAREVLVNGETRNSP
ncbi:MAG: hypothetical protein K9H25_01535 [Rhodospirillum sp.]|nr:hypothetical protein [Rhodospirillum sp.]MCF8488128.1 hypothetical protein [Rhodospirillum sp.]MCF8499980.1 hypothetical protein [Rhodospirillum sp.]